LVRRDQLVCQTAGHVVFLFKYDARLVRTIGVPDHNQELNKRHG
jgi:hypothetical protein